MQPQTPPPIEPTNPTPPQNDVPQPPNVAIDYSVTPDKPPFYSRFKVPLLITAVILVLGATTAGVLAYRNHQKQQSAVSSSNAPTTPDDKGSGIREYIGPTDYNKQTMGSLASDDSVTLSFDPDGKDAIDTTAEELDDYDNTPLLEDEWYADEYGKYNDNLPENDFGYDYSYSGDNSNQQDWGSWADTWDQDIVGEAKNDQNKVSVPPAPLKPTDSESSFTVASWNINFANKSNNVVKGVRALTGFSDIISLQEAHVPATRKALRERILCTKCAYAAYPTNYAVNGSTPASLPIMWRKNKFRLVSSGSRAISGPEVTTRASDKPPQAISAKWLTWVKLRDVSTNRLVVVINTHTVAGVESGGKPVKDQHRVSNYRKHLDTLVETIKQQKNGDTALFVTGDFNVNYREDNAKRDASFPFEKLGRVGVVSGYQSTDLSGVSASTGTQGNGKRLIDYVFSLKRPDVVVDNASVVGTRYGSDHTPVTANITLK